MEEECQLTELPISMCAHCRENGTYTVREHTTQNGENTLNLYDTEVLQTSDLSIDDNGEVWVSPNEAFLRGRFGRGKHLH